MDAAAALDAIVIGSGMGGLAAAAAIAKSDRKVLLLERHYALGGLTQIFSREGFTWAPGVHYIGGLQPGARPATPANWCSRPKAAEQSSR